MMTEFEIDLSVLSSQVLGEVVVHGRRQLHIVEHALEVASEFVAAQFVQLVDHRLLQIHGHGLRGGAQ